MKHSSTTGFLFYCLYLFLALFLIFNLNICVVNCDCKSGFEQVLVPEGIVKGAGDVGYRCCPAGNRSRDSNYELEKTAWYAVQTAYNPGNESYYPMDLYPPTDVISDVDHDWVDGTYAILYDHCLQAIVITIRGTTTLGDDLQDIQAYATNFVSGSFAHIGFLHRTNYLYAHHISTIIHSVQDSHYRILVTGHSLGAAVASLVTLKLQDPSNPFPVPNTTVSGYGYATPGPTFYDPKHNLASAEKNWKSFIYHEDIVARVTWPGTLALLDACSKPNSNVSITIHPDIHDYMLLWMVVQQFSFCAGNTSSGLTKPGDWYYADHYTKNFTRVERRDKAVNEFEFFNSSLADHSGFNYLGCVNKTFQVPPTQEDELLKVDICPPNFEPIRCNCEWATINDKNGQVAQPSGTPDDEITTNSLPASPGSKVIGFVGFHYVLIHPNQPENMLLSADANTLNQNKARWISMAPLDVRMEPTTVKFTPKKHLLKAVSDQNSEQDFEPAAGTISKYWNLMIVVDKQGNGKMWSLDRNELLRNVQYKGLQDVSDLQIIEHTYPLMVLITDKTTGQMKVFTLAGGEANKTIDFKAFKGTLPLSVAVNGNFTNKGIAYVVDSDEQIIQVDLTTGEGTEYGLTKELRGASLVKYSDGMLYVYSKEGVIYIVEALRKSVVNGHKVTLSGVDSMVVDHRLVIFRSSVSGNNQLIYNPYAGLDDN